MNDTYFITGYPGFLASNLLIQLIEDHHKTINHIYLLVLPHMKKQAKEGIEQLSKKNKIPKDNVTLIFGDITKEKLGIDKENHENLVESVTHVFHLAAIYDLAVPKAVAYQVNVRGTNHVNNWVQNLTKLKRYVYFSTAYVSGKREGRIYEHELQEGQACRNHYEHTKYEAELLVQQIKHIVPTTIIRPGVVKGNSQTGETIKFDGLYFMLNLLDKFRFLPIIPYIGEGKAEGNFVPVDYVLKATSYLAINPIGEGKTYHLTDPHPYNMGQIQKMLAEQYIGKTPKGKVPVSTARWPLTMRPVRQWLQAEPEAMDYFTVHSSYDCTSAVTDLEGTGITCPDLQDTIRPMIEFYRKYKDDQARHIRIL